MNKTKEDAYLRITNARIGRFSDKPTLEYLEALRRQLYGWIDEVNREIEKVDPKPKTIELCPIKCNHWDSKCRLILL